MKIAVATDCFPEISETWVYDEVHWLRARGHHVQVIARRRRDADGLPAGDIHAPRAGSRAGRFAVMLRNMVRCMCSDPCAWRMAMRQPGWRTRADALHCWAALHRMHADVLHVHFGSVGTAYMYITDFRPVRLVVTFHGYDLRRGMRDHGRRYRPLFARADAVIAVSGYSRDMLIGFGCPPEKIQVVRLGIDTGLFAPAERKADRVLTILTVARLVEEKDLATALQAVAALAGREDIGTIRYRLAGDGPQRDALEQRARHLALPVDFTGALERQAVADAMRQADVLLLSSRMETAPVVIAEAMACGLPVVATDTGAISEMVQPPHYGALAPVGDAAALADALYPFCVDAGRRRRIGTAAVRHAREVYDIDQCMNGLVRAFQRTS